MESKVSLLTKINIPARLKYTDSLVIGSKCYFDTEPVVEYILDTFKYIGKNVISKSEIFMPGSYLVLEPGNLKHSYHVDPDGNTLVFIEYDNNRNIAFPWNRINDHCYKINYYGSPLNFYSMLSELGIERDLINITDDDWAIGTSEDLKYCGFDTIGRINHE